MPCERESQNKPILNSLTISFYFTGYPKNPKGSRFYNSNQGTKILEIIRSKFIEDNDISSGSHNHYSIYFFFRKEHVTSFKVRVSS